MAYGDPVVGCATKKQSAFGVPGTTFDKFYRCISVTDASGMPSWDTPDTINTALAALPPKAGKVSSKFTIKYHFSAQQFSREFFSAWGLYDAGYPALVGSAAYRHRFFPSADTADKNWYTVQFNVHGRVYTIMDCEVLGWTIRGVDKFIDVEMTMMGTFVSHVEFIPTATVGPATYDGVFFTAGNYNFADAAAVTYNVQCSAAGTIGDGTCAINTKLSTDGAYTAGLAQLVYNNRPFQIRDAAGNNSGIVGFFTTGGTNTLAAGGTPDAWTISTRETASTGTVPTETYFTWNSYEVHTLDYGGSAFTISPSSFELTYDRGLAEDDYVGGRNVVMSHDQAKQAKLSGSFEVRIRDRSFLNDAWGSQQKALKISFSGKQIGSDPLYEGMELLMSQVRIEPFSEQMDGAFIKKYKIPFVAHSSTPTADDFGRIEIDNGLASLDT